ncbi:MAG: DUF3089 domain-containing protein [Sphingobacteriales bacterium]|nr:DUF3089 domain-containing protein [Sphingobacteriales bacterium]
MRFRFLSCLVVIIFCSCSDKYLAFRSHYQFKSSDGKPDYSGLNYWAAHPLKWDPSDSVPEPLRNEIRDSSVDVFFLHPTTFTKRKFGDIPNASVDDAYINAKTDYSTILYQASVFNNQCRIFSPRYRQVHISTFFKQGKENTVKAFDLAYEDLKASFEYYLKYWNNGRPIIIAGHSQGAMMAERLLKDFFENKPLNAKLVAAYVIGWPVPKKYFSSLKMCNDSLQTGCICSWRTLRNGYIPYFLKDEKGNSFVTNPLTWTASDEYVSRKSNKGSVLTHFNKIYRHTTGAGIGNGFLYVKNPKFPWSFLYFTRNYHIADINLFYINLRENIRQRINAYWKK